MTATHVYICVCTSLKYIVCWVVWGGACDHINASFDMENRYTLSPELKFQILPVASISSEFFKHYVLNDGCNDSYHLGELYHTHTSGQLWGNHSIATVQ